MGATFCGKDCGDCGYRDRLSCPGCRVGPGAAVGGDCRIAKCCWDDGRDGCYLCVHQGDCVIRKSRNNEAEHRIGRRKREAELMDQRRKELPPLVRCLTFLFWLTIATSVISLLANEMFFPEYRVQLVFLSAISMFAYSLVLLALSKICDGYRIAGVCGLVFTALDLIADLNEGIELVWIFLLAAAIFGFFMEYQEYLAHADAVEEYDSAVAEQWRSLWLWKLWVTIASIASVFLALFTQFLAAMVLFAATIAGIIISVIHMVYLYRTARVCRNYLSASEG